MSRLTCLACGFESSDVAPTIVAYADPIPVTVHVPVSARQGSIEMPRQVPGRYGAEWRCRDIVACRRRAGAALGAMQVTEPEPRDAPAATEPKSAPDPGAAVVAERPVEDWFA